MRFVSDEFEIEAWVKEVNAKTKFPEHRPEWKTDDKTGRPARLGESYLEIENGKSFSIMYECIRPAAPHPDLEVSVRIDGRYIGGIAWLGRLPTASTTYMRVMDGGVTQYADLVFAPLPTTDDEDLVTLHGQDVDQLCKIEVVIRRGTLQLLEPSAQQEGYTVSNVGVVNETTKKLGSTVRGANFRLPTKSDRYTFNRADFESNVFRFVWKYHTKPHLSLMGIIEDEALPVLPILPVLPVLPILAVQAPALGSVPGMLNLAAFAARLNPFAKRHRPDQIEAAEQRTDQTAALRQRAERISEPAEASVKRVKREHDGMKENKPIVIPDDAHKRQRLGRAGVKAEIIDLTDE